MCRFFDPDVPKQCKEDDAEEVFEKERVNFCEWYKPSPDAFDPGQADEQTRARNRLASLFGEDQGVETDDNAQLRDAEDLFR